MVEAKDRDGCLRSKANCHRARRRISVRGLESKYETQSNVYLFVMNSILWFIIAVLFIIAVWLAWRHIVLRRQLNEYIRALHQKDVSTLPVHVDGIEELSRAVHAFISSLDTQLSALNTEHARLAAVLDQMTDGVVIVDSQGRIQFANPASKKLFETVDPISRSIIEVVRHHQLVEAWRRSQQTRELQSESVEVPARRQFLQLVVIPDQYTDGSLLLVQDLTRVRRTRNRSPRLHLQYLA